MSRRTLPLSTFLALAILGGPGLRAGDDPLLTFFKAVFGGITDRNSQLDQQARQALAFDQETQGSIILANGGGGAWTFGVVGEDDPLNQAELSGGKAVGRLKVADVTYSVSEKRYRPGPFRTLGGEETMALSGAFQEILIAPDLSRASPTYARVVYLRDARGQEIYLTCTPDSKGKAPVMGLTRKSFSVVMTPLLSPDKDPDKTKWVLQYSDPAKKNRLRIGVERLP